MTDSEIASGAYTIGTSPLETVKKPIIKPYDEPFITEAEIEITCSTAEATIYYTTDGSTPTTTSSVYSAAFTITEDKTIKAIAVKGGMKNSEEASKSYIKVVSTGIDLVVTVDSVEKNAAGKLDVTFTVTNQGSTRVQSSYSFESYIYVSKTEANGSRVRTASWSSSQSELDPGKLTPGASVTYTDTAVPMMAGGVAITEGYVWAEIGALSKEPVANRNNNKSSPKPFGSTP